jgi:hypothetical protein
MKEHIIQMLMKTMEMYVLIAFAICQIMNIMFKLGLSRISFDTFTLMVNFLDNRCAFQHIMIELFEALKIVKATLS